MNNKIKKDSFYTVKEVAKFLGVTEQTVSKYLRDGNLKGSKKGPKQKWHVRGDEILKKRKEWGFDN